VDHLFANGVLGQMVPTGDMIPNDLADDHRIFVDFQTF
jgi:hypothetical protein